MGDSEIHIVTNIIKLNKVNRSIVKLNTPPIDFLVKKYILNKIDVITASAITIFLILKSIEYF